ncbi:fatty acid--CoA ligase family protein [Zafaria sp. J156]|uniref:ANL family adenylate-forming protein n=1 Tax=Zafaria sp. J156 TaxID=3116490 RepID=UPI002E77F29D|nr:fatty acid--CoA ligase family protein [Zafaria sp. J156]MEE1620868.1 fatty acid--CoA ligase family protein [Zafaria sp. J156]
MTEASGARLVPVRPADACEASGGRAGDGGAAALAARLRSIRSRGGVPLVGDDRWSPRQWDDILRTCADASPPDDAAWAGLTSGSGGFPRVVMRSAASWSDSFGAAERLLGATGDDVVLLPSPPVSSLTLFSLAHSLEGGPRPVLAEACGTGTGPASTVPDAAEATLFHGTPQALRRLIDAGAPPRLRAALVGGSGLDARLRRDAASRGIRVVSYYGAAELSFVAVDDDGEGYRPFPGVELRTRDGELWVRSAFVASGYLPVAGGRGPGPLRSENGWHTVGDLAELAAGRLRLRGRGDGAILTASATVVPEDVESVLRGLPGIADALVLGLPRAGVGALVAAVVEPADPASPPSAAALRRATRELLAPSHRPRRWFAAELPRTANGKPARSVAAGLVAAGEVARLA